MKEISLYHLPMGWETATIDNLIGINGLFVDGDWIESKDQNPNGGIRLIQLADIGDGTFKDKSNRFMSFNRAVELNCTFLQYGDVLVARMPDPLGRAIIFPYKEIKQNVTVVDVAIIRTGDGVYNKWLMNFINSPEIRKKIGAFQTGTTRKRISRSNLAQINIPVPPLNEQYRIVEKIEELFPDSKKIEECEIENKIEYFKQGGMGKLFRGKFEIEFLKKIIDSLKAKNKTGGYFSSKYTSVHIDPNINILSALADYADTPQCLIDFLKHGLLARRGGSRL